jgi:hypothetical protein
MHAELSLSCAVCMFAFCLTTEGYAQQAYVSRGSRRFGVMPESRGVKQIAVLE